MKSSRLALAVLILGAPLCAALALDRAASKGAAAPKFFDSASQAAEFIGYDRSIALTPEQQKLRDKALSSIPAACCDKFSQAICCCPCNLAKTVWGLSNYMIVRQHTGASELVGAVRAWLKFVNPKGFTGDVCDSAGGCGRTFRDDGCGGMDEKNLLAAR